LPTWVTPTLYILTPLGKETGRKSINNMLYFTGMFHKIALASTATIHWGDEQTKRGGGWKWGSIPSPVN